jgi:S1-C subfamily serine protease
MTRRKEYSTPAALWGFSVNKEKDDKNPGVNVRNVTPGGPAAQAGLRAGDRLLVLSHRWTDSVDDVYLASGFVWPGKSVNLKVNRGNQELNLTVKPIAGF